MLKWNKPEIVIGRRKAEWKGYQNVASMCFTVLLQRIKEKLTSENQKMYRDL